jgi:hypothetical protein
MYLAWYPLRTLVREWLRFSWFFSVRRDECRCAMPRLASAVLRHIWVTSGKISASAPITRTESFRGFTHFRQGNVLVSQYSSLLISAFEAAETELLTNALTPWSTVLPEKLTLPELRNTFPAFYGTWRFITAFAGARHLSLSWAR